MLGLFHDANVLTILWKISYSIVYFLWLNMEPWVWRQCPSRYVLASPLCQFSNFW